MTEKSYTVGYKKPPTSTQFKPGQSGNPRGKPRKLQNLEAALPEMTGGSDPDRRINAAITKAAAHDSIKKPEVMPDLSDEINEMAGILGNIKSKGLDEQRAILKQLCTKAINGNAASSKLLAKVMQQHLEVEPKDKDAEMRNVLAVLEKTTDRASLVEQWRDLYSTEPPAYISRQLMIRAIAYRLQENAYGGLKPATRRFLEKVVADAELGRPVRVPTPILKPGTLLLREWHGVTHKVTILEKGVQYNGNSYRSLTAVARLITGTHWPGPRFFGLNKPR